MPSETVLHERQEKSRNILFELLVCPRDRASLSQTESRFVCPNGHSYPIVEGVPILLLQEVEQTHIEGTRSLAFGDPNSGMQVPRHEVKPGRIDPFVNNAIGATNGALYQHLVGKLNGYPIPNLAIPPGNGRLFLEIGCNWGRWCIAAAKLGYVPIGIDPSLKAILAA